ncbi:hypothetical protein SDIAM26S_01783 [Streptomyces diastaticus subsp. diastaticus]
MDDGDRADPADRLDQRLPATFGLDTAGLEPQQCGHCLEVVLHPVVDLPDGGVLGHQLALTTAQFRDVPEQDQRADVRALGPQRDGPELDDAAVPLDLRLPRRVAAGQLHHRLVDRAPGRRQLRRGLAEVVPDQVGGEPEPVVRGERVRGGVLDDAVGVQADQAVPGARGDVGVALLVGEGEGARGDHLRQVRGALEIGQLQAARGAHGQQVGVAGDDAEDAVLAADRDRLDPDRHLLAPLRVALPHDASLVERQVEHGAPPARHEVADHVVLVGGGAGVGAHLGDRDVAGAVPGGDPQDQVGEGEVGEELPLRDQQVEPFQVGVT